MHGHLNAKWATWFNDWGEDYSKISGYVEGYVIYTIPYHITSHTCIFNSIRFLFLVTVPPEIFEVAKWLGIV